MEDALLHAPFFQHRYDVATPAQKRLLEQMVSEIVNLQNQGQTIAQTVAYINNQNWGHLYTNNFWTTLVRWIHMRPAVPGRKERRRAY